MSRLNRHAAGALDPVVLARALGLEPSKWQEKILRRPHQRDLLVIHRQAGKSTTAAIAAVHAALYEPGSLILIVSRTLQQSGELFKKVTHLYRTLGKPVPLEVENQLSLTLENGSRIVAAAGDPENIRSFSAVKLLIIDEAAFVTDETMAAVRPMLAVSKGRLLAMSTPRGRRGWFYEASKSREWRVTKVTVDECPRISAEYLANERAAVGDWLYKQEWLCEFLDLSGQMFSSSDIDHIWEAARLGVVPPDRDFLDNRIHPVTVGVDIGQSADPTAIVVLNSYLPEPTHIDDKPQRQHLIRSIEKVPLNMSYERIVDRIATVAEYAAEWGHPTIVLDGTGVGRPVVDMLRGRTRLPLRAVTFTGAAHETRSDAYSFMVPKRDLVSSLEVVLQGRRLHATSLGMTSGEDLRAELQSFEVNISASGHDTYDAASGRHDDIVSALYLGLWWQERHNDADAWMGALRRMTARALNGTPAPSQRDRILTGRRSPLDPPLIRELP